MPPEGTVPPRGALLLARAVGIAVDCHSEMTKQTDSQIPRDLDIMIKAALRVTMVKMDMTIGHLFL